MIVLIAGMGDPANTRKNGLGELADALEKEFPGQLTRLACNDKVPAYPGPLFVAAFSHGADLAQEIARKTSGPMYAAYLDGVMRSNWWNPFRPAYRLPWSVSAGRSWTRHAWKPPFSSAIRPDGRDIVNKTIWSGHTDLIPKVIPEVIEFAKQCLKA